MSAVVAILLLVSQPEAAVDKPPQVTAFLDKTQVHFPQKSVAEGVRATIKLLESCHDASEGSQADINAALLRDHVRFVFARPVKVNLGRGTIEVSELVFTQPLNTGVFWLRCGKKILRHTKFEFSKEADFTKWRQQGRAGKGQKIP